MDMADAAVIKQHLIDPEICIRCNTCEATCPVRRDHARLAQLRGGRRQVQPVHGLRPALPHRQHRQLAHRCRGRKAYSVDEQLGWDELPAELTRRGAGRGRRGAEQPAEAGSRAAGAAQRHAPAAGGLQQRAVRRHAAALVGRARLHQPVRAEGRREDHHRHRGRQRARHRGRASDYDTHHIVLDFGAMPFPVLEGQSIGIMPPGTDANGRPHHARQYSIASPRNGERPGYNNLSLTIKRVLEDHQGQPGARRGQQLHVRPAGGRQGAGDRPLRHQLPDAQPPEEPHRDDLHRHRQRADARDDRMAPPAARSRASSRAAS